MLHLDDGIAEWLRCWIEIWIFKSSLFVNLRSPQYAHQSFKRKLLIHCKIYYFVYLVFNYSFKQGLLLIER